MSPIIHAEMGWLIAQPLERRRDRILVTAAAVLSDIDGLGLVLRPCYHQSGLAIFIPGDHNLQRPTANLAILDEDAALIGLQGELDML